jgi:peptidoglycan/xylan/chitin deacetylase (PgdA/CDA1 family)
MALTFDDLPYVEVDGKHDLAAAQHGTASILQVLTARKAPVVAFVNEAKLQIAGEAAARTALLRRWVDVGVILGNHTYSHADFNTLTIREFEDEIAKGDVVTRRLMQLRQPYTLYFRHPETHTGDTEARKAEIEKFLAAKGYLIAPHTIDSSDFIFNAAYVRALRMSDKSTAMRVRSAYVDFVIDATEFAERVSPQIFATDVPQTILLHANDINADCLDELLQRLASRGYRFVSLAEAMADPAYKTPDTFVTKSGPTWLWRWMKSKGMNVSFKSDPDPPDWVMKLYDKPK